MLNQLIFGEQQAIWIRSTTGSIDTRKASSMSIDYLVHLLMKSHAASLQLSRPIVRLTNSSETTNVGKEVALLVPDHHVLPVALAV